MGPRGFPHCFALVKQTVILGTCCYVSKGDLFCKFKCVFCDEIEFWTERHPLLVTKILGGPSRFGFNTSTVSCGYLILSNFTMRGGFLTQHAWELYKLAKGPVPVHKWSKLYERLLLGAPSEPAETVDVQSMHPLPGIFITAKSPDAWIIYRA